MCLLIAISTCSQAQTYNYFTLSTTSSGSVPQIVQDATSQYIGIGVGSANISNMHLAFGVSNWGYIQNSNYPTVVMGAANIVSGSSLGAGQSPFGMLVARLDNTATNVLAADFTVDGNGLVGIGGMSAMHDGASLFVTDPNGQGQLLVEVQTAGSANALIVDQNGLVGVGNFPGVGGTACHFCPLTPGNGNTNAHLFITDQNGDGYPLLAAYTNAGQPSLTALGNGNVGIGTLTPSSPLDVAGNATFENSITVAGSTFLGDYVHVNGNTIVAGSVGIGTTTPAHPLVVNGDAEVGSLYVDATTWNTGNLIVGQSITVSNNEYISGYVQIGNVPTSSTSAPSLAADYMLYVQKGIIAEKFKCALSSDATNWSDYVFDKDYKLASLNEVEEYVKANHHLPDVPSTDDVHCDGVDLAQMDATLLKKIEELTLYVIDLKKDNEAMKAQLSNMKK